MNKLAFKSLLAFLLVVSPFLTEKLLACSCHEIPPIYESFKNAEAVFIGKVGRSEDIKIKDANGLETGDTERLFHFEILENLKGVKGKNIIINSGLINHSCYGGFSVGDTYLVYAQGKDEEYFVFGFCSRVEGIESAQDQIIFIREMIKGKPEAQIYGSVKRYDNSLQTTAGRQVFVEKIKVVIETLNGKGKQFVAVTDKNGLFRFNNIPAGEYRIKPLLPPKYAAFFPTEEKFEVTPVNTILTGSFTRGTGLDAFYAEFSIDWNNQVKGQILDAEGKTVKRACVELLPVALANIEGDFTEKNQPDFSCGNNFVRGGKTPGQYVLAVEIYAPFENGNKIRAFFSQATTSGKATIIDIGETTQFNTGLKLPSGYLARNIEGEVFAADGTRIYNAWVVLKNSETINDDKSWSYDWAQAGYDGKFVLQGFENAEYWVHASVNAVEFSNGVEKQVEVYAKPIKIKVGKNNEPLKLTVVMPERSQ